MVDFLFPIGFTLQPNREISQLPCRHLHADCAGRDHHVVLHRCPRGHHFPICVHQIRVTRDEHPQQGHALRNTYAYFVARRGITLRRAHHGMVSYRLLYAV